MQKTSFFRKLTARPSIFIVLAGLLVMAVAAPAAGAHHKEGHAGGNPNQALAESLNVPIGPITGTITENGVEVERTFEGVFTITGFDDEGGELVAIGNLVGDLNGESVTFQDVRVPVLGADGNGNGQDVCPILFLDIQPVFLDLLGLVVELPQGLQVDIYAERGPGKLLGNLLCAVVGLLDDPVAIDGDLGNLLDRVNRILDRIQRFA